MRRLVVVASAALLLIPLILKSRMSQDIPARTAFHVLSSGMVSVKISGDVRYPGIYEVPANAMATGAINMAIPGCQLKLTKGSEVGTLLLNGSAVTLALQPDGLYRITFASMTVPELLVLRIPLDIASMNEADFDRLPGLGPSLARRIIEYRQNNGGSMRVEDLKKVEGIGEKKYATLSVYFQQAVTTK